MATLLLRRYVKVLRATMLATIAVWCVLALLPSSPAYAVEEHACRVVLYTSENHTATEELAQRLEKQPVAALDSGVLITADSGRGTLEVPDSSTLFITVTAPDGVPDASATLTGFGGAISEKFESRRTQNSVILGPVSPQYLRTLNLSIASENPACRRTATLITASSVITNPVTALSSVLSVVLLLAATGLARLRTRTRVMWWLALCGAVLIASVAGVAASVLLYASSVFTPDSLTGWVMVPLAVAGVLIVAVLPRPHARPTLPRPRMGEEIPDGAVLGRYQVQRVLGSGTTGKTFAAFDPATRSAVACKVLSPQRVHDPLFVQRFFAEAHVMQQLDNPHCVKLLDVLHAPGQMTLVTEYVHGVTLRHVLRDHGQLSGEQALSVLSGALRGLSHLHRRGLIHRDVKPDNIMVRSNGTSTLIDYGLALPSGAQGVNVEGSPSYMSPEQVTRGVLDERSDIYACGSILTELLTGRRIFAGPDISATMRAQVGMSVPDLAHTDSVPKPLAVVAQRALAKNPDERFGSVDEFLSALETAADEVYGDNWVERAALGAVVAGVLQVSAAGAGVLASSGAGSAFPEYAAAPPTSPTPADAPLASAGASSSGSAATTGSIASRALDAGVAVAAAASAVAVSVAAVVVPSEPPSEVGPIITEPQARTEFRAAWDAVLGAEQGDRSALEGRIDESARPALSAGYRDGWVAPSRTEHLIVPYQTQYSASFYVFAHLSDAERVRKDEYNLFVHMESRGANAPWLIVGVAYLAGGTEIPDDVEDNPQYAVAPDDLPHAVAQYLNASVHTSRRVPSELFEDSALLTTEITEARASLREGDGAEYASEAVYTAQRDLNVELPDHSVVVGFHLPYRARFTNDPQNWSGRRCGPYLEPRSNDDSIAADRYRTMTYEIDIYVVGVVLPTDGSSAEGSRRSSVEILSMMYLDTRVEATPC